MCNTTEKNNCVQATSTTTHLIPLNATLNIASVKLHTTNKLPPDSKEYVCFHINKNIYQAAKCVKYHALPISVNSNWCFLL